jgi:hypothetical protein
MFYETSMASLDDGQKQSFDLAADVTKQLITLSTGIIGLTVTFAKDILPRDPATNAPPDWARAMLGVCWLLYICSILFGLLTMLMLTTEIERPAKANKPSIWSRNVRVYLFVQILWFMLATCGIVLFGFKALR